MSVLRAEFADRAALIAYCAEQFPDAAAVCGTVPDLRGGRSAAIARLRAIAPARYAASRNFLSGAVTRLSAYLRHGVISLAEARDTAIAKAGAQAEKLVQELAWRDYWQRVYAAIGDGVWEDREPYKTGLPPIAYTRDLPDDIPAAATGLACMDSFARELHATGYLHNHARMWFAAYIVHHRRVAWQAGARWFLQHLLDGDPASNNLSWQWVASTFSAKPYFFNRDNLERYTDGLYCRACPLARRGCPFDASYDVLAARLFPTAPVSSSPDRRTRR